MKEANTKARWKLKEDVKAWIKHGSKKTWKLKESMKAKNTWKLEKSMKARRMQEYLGKKTWNEEILKKDKTFLDRKNEDKINQIKSEN